MSFKIKLRELFPIAQWLPQYPRDWLRPDLIAGLTAAAVVIPKAMAYATIAGLPLQVGLFTVFIPMVIYAILGTSRRSPLGETLGRERLFFNLEVAVEKYQQMQRAEKL